MYDATIQMWVVYKDVVQNTKDYLQYFFSSEVPSRLSTNTLDIGECDRSEGLRWWQSASWCSRSVVSHLSRMFNDLQFIIDWFVSSRRQTNGIEEGENVTAQVLASTPAACLPETTTWWSTRHKSKGSTGLWRRNNSWRHLREMKLLLCIYMAFGAWVKHVNCFSSNHENIRGMEVQFSHF
jgi:hypothetical protein